MRRARIRAAQLGTSVNAVLRDFIDSWAGGSSDRARAIAALVELSEAVESGRAEATWTREDLHER
ncbi:MAG: hypothetical protein L6R30_09200 [Thermoanaerobaculia bacterium]|nr:hypothetical protein [Thermoanaerobaculia bacterium]